MECQYESHHDIVTHVSVWCQETLYIGAHFHNCLELIYIAEGEVSASIGSQHLTSGKGHLLIVSSFAVHSLYSTIKGKYYIALISRNLLTECSKLLENNDFENVYIADDEKRSLLCFMWLLYNMNRNNGIFKDMLADDNLKKAEMRLVASALVSAITANSKLIPHIRMTDLVAAAVEYIQNNFRHKLLIPEISRALACNSQQLSLQFREIMKVSITDYIASLRTAEVMRLLHESPDMTLEEIADRSGYQSLRTLLRDFKKEYGCTPSEMKHNWLILPNNKETDLKG